MSNRTYGKIKQNYDTLPLRRDLWPLRHWLHNMTIDNLWEALWCMDGLPKSDSGQHSQFLWCLYLPFRKWKVYSPSWLKEDKELEAEVETVEPAVGNCGKHQLHPQSHQLLLSTSQSNHIQHCWSEFSVWSMITGRGWWSIDQKTTPLPSHPPASSSWSDACQQPIIASNSTDLKQKEHMNCEVKDWSFKSSGILYL